jgi:hypothetical protein
LEGISCQKRHSLVILSLLTIIWVGGVIIYREFFSLQSVPKGVLILTIPSPNGKYAICTFSHNGGSLSADAVRGELVDLTHNTRKTVYWNYPDEDPYVEWLSTHTVIIGNKKLNMSKGETYDWRREDNWVRQYPKQFSNKPY